MVRCFISARRLNIYVCCLLSTQLQAWRTAFRIPNTRVHCLVRSATPLPAKLVGCMIVSMAGTMPLQNSASLIASVAALLPRRCRSEASREPPSGTRQAFEYDDAPSIARTINVYSSRYSSSEIAWWNTKQTSFHIAQMNTLSRLCFSGEKGVLKK